MRNSTVDASMQAYTPTVSSSVRDQGIFVHSDLAMHTHVCRSLSSCFAALRHLRSIRHLVSRTVFQSLVAAVLLCRLDYGNGTPAPASELQAKGGHEKF